MFHLASRTSSLFIFVLTLIVSSAQAQPKPANVWKIPHVFSDNMVLQREIVLPVWGWAAPGEKVTVEFAGQTKSAVADNAGKWQIKLEALKASAEPRELTIRGASDDHRTRIGNVLVGEVWIGSGQSNMAWEVSRVLTKEMEEAMKAGPYPKLRLLRTDATKEQPILAWRESTPEQINQFSAHLFSFGLRLQKELDVPVGLIVGAVGLTASRTWISPEAIDADPVCQKAIERYAVSAAYAAVLKKYEQDLEAYKKAVADGKLPTMAPKKPPLPSQTAGSGALYKERIRPVIPYGIRGVLWDQGESGTGYPAIDQYTMMGALISGWRNEWGQGAFPFILSQKPCGGGCAWDPMNPVTRLADKFGRLPAEVPNDGESLEQYLAIRNYPNTAIAISSDLGGSLHPQNKWGYGHRAADVALGMVYERKIEYHGPTYASHKIEADKVRIQFKHVGQGLAFKHGDKLQGFALAGADNEFHWADAKIDGDTVVVSSEKVAQPVAVRYAWTSAGRSWANLFNKDGLPALPFRTDSTPRLLGAPNKQ